jgi:glucose 1-dehydrogenase
MKSVVVTGCGQGIGLAIFERLRREGYAVVGIEWNREAADALLREAGAVADVIVGSASDRSLLEQAAGRADQLGTFWGWVNNAAIFPSTNLHDPDPAEVERVFSVNLMGYYWGCSAAVRALLRDGSQGAIVNISSVHGRAAYSNAAAYDASKGAIDALTRYVAVEYGPVGIRANAVAPGAVRTPMALKLIESADDPVEAEAAMARPHPLRRIAEPEEIAAVAAFLLSEESSFLTGQSIAVDGGLTARCWDSELDPGLIRLGT